VGSVLSKGEEERNETRRQEIDCKESDAQKSRGEEAGQQEGLNPRRVVVYDSFSLRV
jgi:hypothetical protein